MVATYDDPNGDYVSKFREIVSCPVLQVLQNPNIKTTFQYLRDASNWMMLHSKCLPWLDDVVSTSACVNFYSEYLSFLLDTKEMSQLQNITSCTVANFTKLHLVLWNVTDKNQEVCHQLQSNMVFVKLMDALTRPELALDVCMNFNNARFIVQGIVGIMHNLILRLPCIRSQYRALDIVPILLRFVADIAEAPATSATLRDNQVSFQTACLFLLSFVVDEQENSSLHANDCHIIHILSIVDDALNAANLYSSEHGFHAVELFKILGSLAGPLHNKKALIKNGAVELARRALTKALELANGPAPWETNKRTDLASLVLEFLWILSFEDFATTYLLEHPDILEGIDLFRNKNLWTSNCSFAVQGLLWNIKKSVECTPFELSSSINRLNSQSSCHIMISYQHSTKSLMEPLRNELTSRGLSIWIDIDHMDGGSFVDAMATAVQNSSLLLLGVCQAFKNSPNCRQEVLYAFEKHIPMIPIKLEPDYNPDGWLGFAIATEIFLVLTSENEISGVADQLISHLHSINHVAVAHLQSTFVRTPRLSTSLSCFSQPSMTPLNYSDGFRNDGVCTNHDRDTYYSATRRRTKLFGALSSSGQCRWSSTSLVLGQRPPPLCISQSSSPLKPEPLYSGTSNGSLHISSSHGLNGTPPGRECFALTMNRCTSALNESQHWDPHIGLPEVQSQPPTQGSAPSVIGWTGDQVSAWMVSTGIVGFTTFFESVNGQLLQELAKMHNKAPEFTAGQLFSHYDMGLVDQLRLYAALDHLFPNIY